MIKNILVAGACMLALVAQPALAEEDVIEAPTMSFGTWGFDTSMLSPEINPGNDFFGFANQKWLDENPLPAEYSRYGAFNLLRDKSTHDVQTLIDDLVANSDGLPRSEKRIVDAYNAYLDTDAIDASDLGPARPYLDAIRGTASLAELVTLWGSSEFSAPMWGFVTVDAKEPTRYSVYVGSGGLGMPDRTYYLDDSEKGLGIQEKYRAYLEFLLDEAGIDDAPGMAQQVYDFEDAVARTVSWDRTVRRNRDLTYNAMTPEQLREMGGNFPTGEFLAAAGFDATDRFVVSDLPPTEERAKELGLSEEVQAKIGGGTPAMLALLSEIPIEVLQAWTTKEFLSSNAAVLPTRFDEASFDFSGRTLSGTPEQRPRWKRAIGETERMLGELVGASYVERYFPPENKAAMDELVENLRKALGQSIDEISWMGEDTKVEARKKLAKFDPKIGYRDNLETYDDLEILAGEPLANRMAGSKWRQKDNLSKLGGPIDRTEWGMLPQTVNAYYSPTKNEIVFPAGILQQPFYGASADPAVNYGGIGAVIGHEMGHGFDDQGSKSDGTGMLRNWWTDEDRAAFDELGNALVEQFDGFCPLDDGETCVNGRFTLGENIGDVGGLNLAYRAYKLSLNGEEAPVIDGLTGDQRFFLAWAQVWRSQQREDNYRRRLRTDPHSPEEYRVNGVVRQMDAWYAAFGVEPGDDLYLPNEERVVIW
jgi:putative endopeptidase